MPGKKTKLALAAAFALAASAGYVEGTGYALFDRADGTNVLCDADPACRSLTAGEVREARTIYGDEIAYRSVKIFNRPNYIISTFKAIFGVGSDAEAPNGNIYIRSPALQAKDFAKKPYLMPTLIHELGHVWQRQSGRNLAWEAISAYIHAKRDYDSIYKYSIGDDRPFSAFNLEQQADMAADYWGLRNTYNASADSKARVATNCGRLRKFEDKLSQALPVTPASACRAYAPDNG